MTLVEMRALAGGNMRSQFWRETFLIAAVAGMLLVSVTGAVVPMIRGSAYIDFTVFWAAANMPAVSVYDLDAITRFQHQWFGHTGPRPFAYPPTALLFIRPFGLLPFVPALASWGVLGLAAYCYTGWRFAGRWPLLFATISPAVTVSLLSGQTSLFVGALTMGGLASSNSLVAGALLGTAAAIKPQLFVLLPLALVAGRRWATLVFAGAAFVTLALATVALWGLQPWFDWIVAVENFPRLLREIGLQSHGITLNAYAAAHGLPTWTFLAGAPFAVAMVWLAFSRSQSPIDHLLGLVCGAALLSPYMLHYDLAALAVAAGAVLLDQKRSVLVWLGAALAVTYVLAGLGILILATGLSWKLIDESLARRRRALAVSSPVSSS